MSLDVMLCKIVPPAEADTVLEVSRQDYLRVIQEKGFVCVRAVRIGRNCLSDEWHKQDRLAETLTDQLWENGYKSRYLYIEQDGSLNDWGALRFFRPDDIEELKKWIRVEGDGSWFQPEKLNDNYDFIYIDW